MHKLEADREKWPQALREAEVIAMDELKAENPLTGLLIIDQSLWYGGINGDEERGTKTQILYQESKGAPRRHIAFIQIEQEAYIEYKEWFDMKMQESREAFREAVARKLIADGHYSKRSAGLRQAIKISQMLLTSTSSKLPMEAFKYMDGRLYDGSSIAPSYAELRKLPALFTEEGDLTKSARLAFSKLHASGMVEFHGATKNRTYSLANWQG
jgi:hypothetical protein